MSPAIALKQVKKRASPPPYSADSADSAALDISGTMTVTLRFLHTARDPESVEALRAARRSMLREEWTRGCQEGEPSLKDALFSASEIVWTVPPEQRSWCLEKLNQLLQRANRNLKNTVVSDS